MQFLIQESMVTSDRIFISDPKPTQAKEITDKAFFLLLFRDTTSLILKQQERNTMLPSILTPAISNGTFAINATYLSSPMSGRTSVVISSRRSACVVEARATRRENTVHRHERIRKKVEGTPERPRMSIYRSNKHLFVQVIDDTKMHTLASVSTMQKSISQDVPFTAGPTIEVAKRIGEVIAKSCLDKGIKKVAFDRGGFLYHGRIQAFADSAREHGLEF
ncbi:hypothetical protein LUZ60_011275 [Juncus effusus]|nr:hypothetical protein LUZ60_011275 [Juncus effusus]